MAEFCGHATGIEGLQAVSGCSARSFPRHTHDDFGFGVMVSGGQISASGRGQVEAGPGQIITVNPGEVHDGMPLGGRARTWHMFYLSPGLMDDLGEGLGAGSSQNLEFQYPVLGDATAARKFMTAWSFLTSSPASTGRLAQEEHLLNSLGGLIGERSIPPSAERTPHQITRLRAMIDDDVCAEHSLADLAHEAGLSRFQTLRAFARATGLTPHAYMVEKRLQAARRMILAGHPIADAALASGFADQSHMTRAFSSRYGLTPAAAQRAARAV